MRNSFAHYCQELLLFEFLEHDFGVPISILRQSTTLDLLVLQPWMANLGPRDQNLFDVRFREYDRLLVNVELAIDRTVGLADNRCGCFGIDRKTDQEGLFLEAESGLGMNPLDSFDQRFVGLRHAFAVVFFATGELQSLNNFLLRNRCAWCAKRDAQNEH